MNRKEVKSFLPILQAFADGKEIEGRPKGFSNNFEGWMIIDAISSLDSIEYRIKPEPKYRSFANAEECWEEMLKHQPFGWLKYKKYGYFALITTIHSGNTVSLNGKEGWDFLHIMNNYVFADNIPFGVKVEE